MGKRSLYSDKFDLDIKSLLKVGMASIWIAANLYLWSLCMENSSAIR